PSPLTSHLLSPPLAPPLFPYPTLFRSFCGLPLYLALRSAGKEVFLANLSFTRLESVGRGDWLGRGLVRVTADSEPPGYINYFPRSEEHTSELQSLAYLVCRPLPEKTTS